MNLVWSQIREGVQQARWLLVLVAWLLPCVTLAILIARVLPHGWGGVSGTGFGPLGYLLVGVAIAAALAVAILRDPSGWVRRPVLDVLLLLVAVGMIWRALHESESEQGAPRAVTLGGRTLEVWTLAPGASHSESDPRPTGQSTRSLQLRYRAM